ncbi:MAG: hypothetical protein Unbinned3891contig1000_60 [Prokaryotic dsDNA virus sp.]|nr:MAG: hypothetical protein Unbinned3891contig1000_60 [Prokaryotic dsDNA virus sp.]|tara:strand:- start:59988 stop:60440 length:453 start_codon:yes stop_codon:yes gene_type:complete
MSDTTQTEKEIAVVCTELQNMLIQKNRAYGDSALNPMRVFSNADVVEQIHVRMDDKLSRIVRSRETGKADALGEDVILDLLGYLVLLRIARLRRDQKTGTKIDMKQPTGDEHPSLEVFGSKTGREAVDLKQPTTSEVQEALAHLRRSRQG